MFLRMPASLAVLALLHFCSLAPVLNALAPRDDVRVTRDIAFADGSRSRLDVYAPRPAVTPAPVMVFFYGGGWASGSKAAYRYVGAALAERGVLVVIPDYRLYPQIRFPAFMADAAAAVGWTQANATRFGGDPHRLFLMGHSAGGQIAALLALDPRYLATERLAPRDLCGVIGLAAPYDFQSLHGGDLSGIFGPEAGWAVAEPIAHLPARTPPMLLLAGSLDRTVDPATVLRFAQRLRDAGNAVEQAVYPHVGHVSLVTAFSRMLGFVAPARAAVLRFVAAQGACGGASGSGDGG